MRRVVRAISHSKYRQLRTRTHAAQTGNKEHRHNHTHTRVQDDTPPHTSYRQGRQDACTVLHDAACALVGLQRVDDHGNSSEGAHNGGAVGGDARQGCQRGDDHLTNDTAVTTPMRTPGHASTCSHHMVVHAVGRWGKGRGSWRSAGCEEDKLRRTTTQQCRKTTHAAGRRAPSHLFIPHIQSSANSHSPTSWHTHRHTDTNTGTRHTPHAQMSPAGLRGLQQVTLHTHPAP